MSPQDRLKAIGAMLTARRTSLDPARFRARPGWMKHVKEKAGLSQRVIIDIETGARDTYREETLSTLEALYRLQSGSLRAALVGSGPLIADDGTPLESTEGAGERYVVEERTHRLTGRVQQIVRDLEADISGIPEDVAEEMIQRAMDNAEAQARLMLESDLRRWERRQKQEDPSEEG